MKSLNKMLLIAVILLLLLLLTSKLYGFPLRIRRIIDELPGDGSYGSRDLEEIHYIVIHHSASENQNAHDYARYHLSKGWPGIGYHYVIQPNGQIFQTQELTTVSYHVKNHNTISLGIVLSGDLNQHPMSNAPRRALILLIRRLKVMLPNDLQVVGHGELKATDCPGAFVDVGSLNFF